MKIHILYNLKCDAWGGGNQFLKILRQEFIDADSYTDYPEKSDVILFNSYHNISEALKLKIKFPEKIFVHRLGPVFHLHRGKKWKTMDKLIVEVSNSMADLTFFQSQWAYNQALELGFNPLKKKAIIGNSTDNKIFNMIKKSEIENRKIKLVADCWSKNWKKGFEFYKFLDENLDFNHYTMTFIGNSPIIFKNIAMLPPLPGKELASELKKNDIFISAVSDDAYSNSIVEALACDLPVIGLDSGGNAEIIKNGGVLFKDNKDLIEKISQVRNNYSYYKNNIQLDSASKVAKKYIQSIGELKDSSRKNFLFNLKIIALYIKLTSALLRTKI